MSRAGDDDDGVIGAGVIGTGVAVRMPPRRSGVDNGSSVRDDGDGGTDVGPSPDAERVETERPGSGRNDDGIDDKLDAIGVGVGVAVEDVERDNGAANNDEEIV